MIMTICKILGISIAIFVSSVFAISVGVEIGLRAYFEYYKNSSKKE